MNKIFYLPLLALVTSACTAPPPVVEAEPRDMSTATRWVLVRAPNAQALLEAPAHVVASTPAAAEVTVLHSGRIRHFHVAPGDAVQQGQPIADVVLPEVLEAAARLLVLRGQIEATQDRLSAVEALRKEGLARTEQLFDLKDRLNELMTSRGVSQAVLHSYGLPDSASARIVKDGGLTLTSPAEGVVTELHGRLGAIVGPGDPPLAIVEGPRLARIEASIINTLPPNLELDFLGQDGRTVALSPTPLSRWVDGHTGRVTVWLSPAEPTKLADGLAGRVRLTPAPGAVEVPSRSLLKDEQGHAVWVLKGEATEKVRVEVVLDSGTTALVRGELAAGDRVAQNAEEITL